MSEMTDEEKMENQMAMALHQANAKNGDTGKSPEEQMRILDNAVESELETNDGSLENLSAKDFPLANYDETVDTTEFKWMQEILNIFSKADHPHQGSCLQGLTRAWAVGDPNDRAEALKPGEIATDEAYLLGTYSRAKRGEDMAQQETSAKQVTESHAIHEGGSSSEKGGGILGWRS